ncbi:MAG: hypothetical protein SGPRY_010990 [Prymnesium sp.]
MADCARRAEVEQVSALLAAGVSANAPDPDGIAPLLHACAATEHEGGARRGVVNLLLSARARVDVLSPQGKAALHTATHSSLLQLLLEARADPERKDREGRSALWWAVARGDVEAVQLLSSYNASRNLEWIEGRESALHMALRLFPSSQRGEESGLVHFLEISEAWSTPLHHLSIVTPERALLLLREGAELHATADPFTELDDSDPDYPSIIALKRRSFEWRGHWPLPSPLSLALQFVQPVVGSTAELVIRASEPWSIENHFLFPCAARAFAVQLFLVGCQLFRKEQFGAHEGALLQIWQSEIMPILIHRGSGVC